MKNTKFYLIIFYFSVCFSSSALSSEFYSSDIFPTIHSIAFNKNSVGFSSSMEDGLYSQLYTTYVYFIYDRKSKITTEINEKDFLLQFENVQQIMSSSSGMTKDGIKYKTTSVFCENDDDRWTTGKSTLTINDMPIDIKALNKCSSISLVEVVNIKQLWIATYQVGGHGDYGSEGIVVQDLNSGKLISRINTIKDLFTGMYLDPFSKNMWLISKGATYEVNPTFNIVSQHMMSHGFNSATGEPRFTFSKTHLKINDFSVMSRYIPSKDREKFYKVVLNIPIKERKKFKLYDFFMLGGSRYGEYPTSFQMLTPFFVNKFNDDSGSKEIWQQLLCRIGGVHNKQYCKK